MYTPSEEPMAKSNAVVNDQQQEPVVACTLNLSSEDLSDSQVIGLNAYDFLAFLGKRVINPGGLGGRKRVAGGPAATPRDPPAGGWLWNRPRRV